MNHLDNTQLNPYIVYAHAGKIDAQSNSFPYRTVMFYEIELIVESTGGMDLRQDSSIPLKPGTLIFRRPGTLTRASGVYRYYSLVFDSFYDPNYQEKYALGSSVVHRANNTEDLFGYCRHSCEALDALPDFFQTASMGTYLLSFEKAFHHYLERKDSFQFFARTELLSILTRLLEEVSGSHSHADTRIIELMQNIKSYMDLHYDERISLNTLSEKASLCREHLCRQFRKIYHTSPMDYLKSVRIYHAKFLLTNTQKPISQIAAECGFSSDQFFYKAFKEAAGVSPSRYRRENLSAEP